MRPSYATVHPEPDKNSAPFTVEIRKLGESIGIRGTEDKGWDYHLYERFEVTADDVVDLMVLLYKKEREKKGKKK